MANFLFNRRFALFVPGILFPFHSVKASQNAWENSRYKFDGGRLEALQVSCNQLFDGKLNRL